MIVAATESPITLYRLRKYLADRGMTTWHLPTRLEHVESLPRTGNGKVRGEQRR